MFGGGPGMFNWPRWIAEGYTLIGGLLMLAIVGVLSAVSVAWDWVRRRGR